LSNKEYQVQTSLTLLRKLSDYLIYVVPCVQNFEILGPAKSYTALKTVHQSPPATTSTSTKVAM